MKAPPMKIYMKENATPYRVPKRFKEAAQIEIDNHLASGVMVKCDDPADCAMLRYISIDGYIMCRMLSYLRERERRYVFS